MLVKYVRDLNRQPVATIVAVDKDRVGVSVCNPLDCFNKQLGVQIAAQRAYLGKGTKIPNRIVNYGSYHYECPHGYDTIVFDEPITLSEVLIDEYDFMLDRAERYFKDNNDIVSVPTVGDFS